MGPGGSGSAADDAREVLRPLQAVLRGQHVASPPCRPASGRQRGATAAAPRVDDGTACAGAHAQPETVLARTAPVVRLKGPLGHGSTPLCSRKGLARLAMVTRSALGRSDLIGRERQGFRRGGVVIEDMRIRYRYAHHRPDHSTWGPPGGQTPGGRCTRSHAVAVRSAEWPASAPRRSSQARPKLHRCLPPSRPQPATHPVHHWRRSVEN